MRDEQADLVVAYLAQVRGKLRAPDADLVIAEAEDHLRESVAAGVAIGMTEREAQEAAISAFGSVGAVVRAHRRPASAVAAEVANGGMEAGRRLPARGARRRCRRDTHRRAGPLPYSTLITNGPPDVLGLAAALSGSGIAGLALLLGYWRMCQSRRHRGQSPRPPFGAFFPLVAAICCSPGPRQAP
jgi:hypothetical protein